MSEAVKGSSSKMPTVSPAPPAVVRRGEQPVGRGQWSAVHARRAGAGWAAGEHGGRAEAWGRAARPVRRRGPAGGLGGDGDGRGHGVRPTTPAMAPAREAGHRRDRGWRAGHPARRAGGPRPAGRRRPAPPGPSVPVTGISSPSAEVGADAQPGRGQPRPGGGQGGRGRAEGGGELPGGPGSGGIGGCRGSTRRGRRRSGRPGHGARGPRRR